MAHIGESDANKTKKYIAAKFKIQVTIPRMYMNMNYSISVHNFKFL